MVSEHGLSVRQACRTARLERSAFYVPRRPRDDGPVIAAIEGYVRDNPRHGCDKLYPGVRGQGFGKCRLYRVYRALRLNIKRRGKRRLPERVKAPLVIPAQPNEVWSADFMSDALWSGRRFRTFNVIDDFNRTYREEVLNCYVFETLGEVRRMTAEWITRYNEIRTHESLGDLTPGQYLMAKSP